MIWTTLLLFEAYAKRPKRVNQRFMRQYGVKGIHWKAVLTVWDPVAFDMLLNRRLCEPNLTAPDLYVTRLVLAALTTLWSAHPWMYINESVEIPIFFTKYMKTVIVDGYRRLKMIYVTQVHSTIRHGHTGRSMASTDHFSDPWRINLLVTQLFVDDNLFGLTKKQSSAVRAFMRGTTSKRVTTTESASMLWYRLV